MQNSTVSCNNNIKMTDNKNKGKRRKRREELVVVVLVIGSGVRGMRGEMSRDGD